MLQNIKKRIIKKQKQEILKEILETKEILKTKEISKTKEIPKTKVGNTKSKECQKQR